jgi:hypothetical protein
MKLIRCLSAPLPLALVLLSMGSTAWAQDKAQTKIQASSIQILAVQSDEVKLPIEFQLALYENLIEQVPTCIPRRRPGRSECRQPRDPSQQGVRVQARQRGKATGDHGYRRHAD